MGSGFRFALLGTSQVGEEEEREGEENQAGEKEHEKQNAILKTKVILCMHATR